MCIRKWKIMKDWITWKIEYRGNKWYKFQNIYLECPRRDTHRSAPGWKKCGKNCPVCPLAIKPTKTVISPITNFSLQIQTPVSCESENIIYMGRCKKTNCPLKDNNWYIGLSKRKFKTRISEHRDYVKFENINEPSR